MDIVMLPLVEVTGPLIPSQGRFLEFRFSEIKRKQEGNEGGRGRISMTESKKWKTKGRQGGSRENE